MVKWAANRAPDNESVREGTVVVGTVGTDGEESITGSNERHFLVPDVSADYATLSEGLDVDTGRQVNAHQIRPFATSALARVRRL